MYFVYILECSNKALYTGITNNLDNRLEMHTNGKGSKYVRAHLPFKLIYSEQVETKSEALKREYNIKQMSRAEKLLLISKSII
jgi:putative endonuclease